MKIFGLTGQSGTGKSTFADIARQNGFEVIDCDKAAHEVTKMPNVLQMLEAQFKNVVVNGILDRKALAQKAFADKNSTDKLNSIMLPVIVNQIDKKIAALENMGTEYLILDAPTLFESGIDKKCTAVVAVLSDLELRKKRLILRDNLDEKQLNARLSASKEDMFFTSKTGYIIYNNGNKKEFEADIKSMIQKLKKQ